MKLWISDIEHPDSARNLLKQYPSLRLETLRFSDGAVLDAGDLPSFQREYGAFLGRGFSLHGPYVDLNPASCDQAVRTAAFSRFAQAYHTAEQLGADGIVFHSGWLPAPYGFGNWVENSARFWNEFLDSVPSASNAAPKIHVENMYEPDWRPLAELAKLVPRLDLCFDAGHANAFSTLSPEQWITGLGNHIGHVHLHNNDGTRDAHRGFACGSLDMAALFLLLSKKLPEIDAVLEIPSPAELAASLEWAFLHSSSC